MQLAKNNNAMWRVISDRDQPLPPDAPQLITEPWPPPTPHPTRTKKVDAGPKKCGGIDRKSHLKKKDAVWPSVDLTDETVQKDCGGGAKKKKTCLANMMFTSRGICLMKLF